MSPGRARELRVESARQGMDRAAVLYHQSHTAAGLRAALVVVRAAAEELGAALVDLRGATTEPDMRRPPKRKTT
jgi:hypothetical protein